VALSATAALVRVHFQSVWNEIARSAGLAGKVATYAMIAVAGGVLLGPGLFAVRLGLDLGSELAQSGDPGVLRNWNGLIATFTFFFAILGAFRFKPAFPFTKFGRYPLTPLQLLAADLPASVLEVFPLLGAVASAFMNAGLAIRMPSMAPLIVLLTLDGVVTLLSLMILFSALFSAIARRKALLLVGGAMSIGASFWLGGQGLKLALREWLPTVVQQLPIAYGYRGVMAIRAGQRMQGIAGLAVATLAAAMAFGIAAWVHRRRVLEEFKGSDWNPRTDSPLRFSSCSSAIGLMFFRQLMRSTAVRAQIVLPLIFTALVALLEALLRKAAASGNVLPEPLLSLALRVRDLPLYAIVPVLAVAMNPQIWMNQFGWDRGGVKTILILPMDGRDVLWGKLRGLTAFTIVQTLVGILPLFAVRPPSVREIVIGVAVGGVTLIVTTSVGHFVSCRFPRGIDGAAGLQIPLHLAWVSPVTIGSTVLAMIGMLALGDLLAAWAGLSALVILLIVAMLGYRAILPRFVVLMRENRERLLSM
jgi:hypothetical protein